MLKMLLAKHQYDYSEILKERKKKKRGEKSSSQYTNYNKIS